MAISQTCIYSITNYCEYFVVVVVQCSLRFSRIKLIYKMLTQINCRKRKQTIRVLCYTQDCAICVFVVKENLHNGLMEFVRVFIIIYIYNEQSLYSFGSSPYSIPSYQSHKIDIDSGKISDYYFACLLHNINDILCGLCIIYCLHVYVSN